MKSSFIPAACGLVMAGAFSLAIAQTSPSINLPSSSAPAAAAPTNPVVVAPAATYTEAQIIEAIGWLMGQKEQIDTFGFTEAQLQTLYKGFSLAAAEKEYPISLEKIGPQVEEFVMKRQDAYLARLKSKGQEETTKHFAALKARGVTITPSGLGIEVQKAGTPPNAKATDTVRAHYTGTLVNGEVFDTSREPMEPGKAAEAAEFALEQVIPGWTEGLQKVGKGGVVRLHVPPALGYGDNGRGPIPPASTLIFDIEILDIKPTPGPASMGMPTK